MAASACPQLLGRSTLHNGSSLGGSTCNERVAHDPTRAALESHKDFWLSGFIWHAEKADSSMIGQLAVLESMVRRGDLNPHELWPASTSMENTVFSAVSQAFILLILFGSGFARVPRI
jgi:hypothetical protein